jgi:O-antigen/teichoic acid export membrane protein
LLLLAAPVVNEVLELGSLPIAALTAVAVIPLTMMGAQAGILQGERRWRELAVLYVLIGLPRLVIGVALIMWQPTALMAFLSVTIGLIAPYAYGHAALRGDRVSGDTHESHGFVPTIKETALNSQALLAFFALTNADMLVSRTVLDPHESGLYAAGLIVARAVLFLPQFVVVVAFPSMSTEHSRTRALVRSLALVAGLGALCITGTALLPRLALVFAGGSDYAEIDHRLWLFAALGTLMAVLQLLVYSVLARQGRLSVYLVWLALASMVALASTVSTVVGLLAVVLVVDTSLLLALATIAYVTASRIGRTEVARAH